MANKQYRTTPDHETKAWPKGVPYIIGNEGCERFSYYGMKSILTIHLTTLFAAQGLSEAAAESEATAMYHLFVAGVYGLPMIGALLADRFAGKYSTILWLSLVYCAGHAVLAVGENSISGMAWGLGLIAVGSGGIKPCVSAHVGDQFGRGNWFRVKTIFQAFYFIVNFGSFFSTLLIPIIRDKWGTSVAFGLPGVLMFIATILFWAGRNKFVHVPARPGGRIGLLDTFAAICFFLSFGHLFLTAKVLHLDAWALVGSSIGFLLIGFALFTMRQRIQPDDGFFAILLFTLRAKFRGAPREETQRDASHPLAASTFWGPAVQRYGGEAAEGPVAVLKIISVFFLVSIFWALFEQHSSTWILQAKSMELDVAFKSEPLLPSQTSALNPLLVMLLIPGMNVVYRFIHTRLGFEFTPLRRMTVGMFISGGSFVSVALIQERIDALGAGVVPVEWQVVPYFLVTLGEVMVSVTGLEFAYTQAPPRMKSTLMGFWYLTNALGQVLVALLAGVDALEAAQSFWVYAWLAFGAAALFGLRARFYTPRDYTQ